MLTFDLIDYNVYVLVHYFHGSSFMVINITLLVVCCNYDTMHKHSYHFISLCIYVLVHHYLLSLLYLVLRYPIQ